MDKFTYHDNGHYRRTMIPVSDDKFVVQTSMDLEGILDGVQRDRELIDPRATNKLVARVPMTIYEQSLLEGWDEGDWKKWLNNPDNEPFRVWKGRV